MCQQDEEDKIREKDSSSGKRICMQKPAWEQNHGLVAGQQPDTR